MSSVLRSRFHGHEWFERATSHWHSRFGYVEERLTSTLRYVEIHQDNRATFSAEFASILRDTGAAFGSLADALVSGAGFEPRRGKQYDFLDYRDFLRAEVLDVSRLTVQIRSLHPEGIVVPFEELEEEDGVPGWWTAHNKVKHQD